MKAIRVILVLALATCFHLATAGIAQAQSNDAAIATATTLLDHMEAGEFDAATGDFNAQMRSALDAGKLREVQAQLEAAGPVASRGEPKVAQQAGHTVVLVRILRQGATIDASIAIDDEGKVAGLYFVPAADGRK